MKNLVCKTNHVSVLFALSTVIAAGTASAQTADSQPEVEPAPEAERVLEESGAATAAPTSSEPAEEAVDLQAAPAPAEQPSAVPPLSAEPKAGDEATLPPQEPVAEQALPPEPKPADTVTPLKVTGSFFSRYELREGYAEQGLAHPRLHREGDNFVYRARLGLATNPVDMGAGSTVSAVFVPQAHGTHSTQGAPPTIGDSYALSVYEAYVAIQGERLGLQVGRFAMNYGDALVIGDLGWNEAARAFQGARVRYASADKYWVDFFATLISEGRPATQEVGDGDRYFYGVYAGLGPLLGELDFDIYLLGESTMAQDVDVSDPMDAMPELETLEGASEFTLGSRLAQKIAMFDYRVEAGLQFGSVQGVPGGDSRSKFAYQADAEIGIAPATGLRFGVGGLVASGDDDPMDDSAGAWNELYPTGHKFLGLADVFGARTNALSARANVSYKAAESLILRVDGHLLSRAEEVDGESFTGSELDVNVISPLGKGAVVRAMYAAFLPNTDYWPEDNAIHYLELQFGYDFK